MDWELKASGWDFTDFGREDDTRLATLVGSSSLGVHKNGRGFSVDLKLGGLGDLGDGSIDKLKEPGGSTIASSPSGSLKRTRAINGTQNVSCLVDGCIADLSNCREYHRRHRVCERHSKTPVVIVGGKEQRFCQQCSRFQSLGEFDEEKRSCRKRLDGHNRRRRKPQPEAFYMSSGSFLSNHQVGFKASREALEERIDCKTEGGSENPLTGNMPCVRLLNFTGPQAYTTSTTGAVPTWPRVSEYHQDLHVVNQQSTTPNTLGCVYNGGDKRFPFLLANEPERSSNQAVPEFSICQRLLNKRASPERGRGFQKILSDGLVQSVNSKLALSLLSSNRTQNSETSLTHILQRDMIHPNQPMGMSFQFDGLAQYSRSQGVVEEKPPVLVPQGGNTNNLCNEIFQVAPYDFLEEGASQVIPFSWK
ncbi:unnamed protein product [Camellia sinensis]